MSLFGSRPKPQKQPDPFNGVNRQAIRNAHRAGYLLGLDNPWESAVDNPYDFSDGEEAEFDAFELGFRHGSMQAVRNHEGDDE